MARYANEFVGMRGGFSEPTGSDPNYRRGYQGMRMDGRPGRARYGAHRQMHRYDLGSHEGFPGIHGGHPHRGYDFEYDRSSFLGQGGRSREMMRDFHAGSRALQGGGEPRYGRDFQSRFRPEAERGRYRPSYTNRGVREAGFSEDWGPFRPGPGR